MEKPIWFLLVLGIAVVLLLIWLGISGMLSSGADVAAQGIVDFFNSILGGGVPKG